MARNTAEPRREIDFGDARRGSVLPRSPGKTKISIRLDTAVLDHFREQVARAGGGNYQALINDALVEHIARGSILDDLRLVLREELSTAKPRSRTMAASRKRVA